MSIAVLETLTLAARDGVNALDEAYRRLGLKGSGDDSVTMLPGSRWCRLLDDLFPGTPVLGDPRAAPSRHPTDLPTSADDERVIRRLVAAAASFLLAESVTLEDHLELWCQLVERPDGDLDAVRGVMRRAANTSHTLLDHAEDGRWRALLAAHVPPEVRERHPHEADTATVDGQHRLAAFSERAKRIAVLSRRSDLQDFEPAVLNVLARLASETLQEDTRSFIQLVDLPHHTGDDSDLDLLKALSVLTRSEKPDLVVVVSGGLRSNHPWELEPSQEPHRMAVYLESQGLLPLLRDTTVVLTGLTSERVVTYWRTICSAAGADALLVSDRNPRSGKTPLLVSREPPVEARSTFLNVVGTWGSTVRAAVMVIAMTVGIVATIIALGPSGQHSFGWLFGIGASAIVVGRFAMPLAAKAVPRRQGGSWWQGANLSPAWSPADGDRRDDAPIYRSFSAVRSSDDPTH